MTASLSNCGKHLKLLTGMGEFAVAALLQGLRPRHHRCAHGGHRATSAPLRAQPPWSMRDAQEEDEAVAPGPTAPSHPARRPG